jgi:hypothetical protein
LAVVASLRKEGDLKDFAMPVRMRLGLSGARIEVTAMLDIGADENFISYRFLLEAGWELIRSLEQSVKFVDGQVITCFAILNLDTTVIDI